MTPGFTPFTVLVACVRCCCCCCLFVVPNLLNNRRQEILLLLMVVVVLFVCSDFGEIPSFGFLLPAACVYSRSSLP